MKSQMKVGTAQVDITPVLPFPINSSFHMRIAKKVIDPLFASCIVVDCDGSEIMFVSCDLANIKNDVVDKIKEKIITKIPIAKDRIIVSSTHNHQGPKTGMNAPHPWEPVDPVILNKLLDDISKSAVEAYKDKKPARMGFNSGRVRNCNFNRRYIMSNGRSVMADKIGYDPERVQKEGPVDEEVQVIWFEDLDKEIIGAMFSFACHPVTLFLTENVSACFPGEVRRVVQTVINKKIPVMFLQGACGNTETVDFDDEKRITRGLKARDRAGRILGGEVLKLLYEDYVIYGENVSAEDIKIDRAVLQMPMRKIDEKALERGIEKWGTYTENDKKDPGSLEKATEMTYAFSQIALKELIEKGNVFPVAVSAVKIFDIYFLTTTAELFCEYQLFLKERFKDKKIVHLSFADGYVGYVPTRLAHALGGYGTEAWLGSKLEVDAGDVICEKLIELAEKLRT